MPYHMLQPKYELKHLITTSYKQEVCQSIQIVIMRNMHFILSTSVPIIHVQYYIVQVLNFI